MPSSRKIFVVDRNGAFCCIFTHCLRPPDLTVTYNEPKTTTKIRSDVLYLHFANKVTCIRFLSDLVSDLINSVYLL